MNRSAAEFGDALGRMAIAAIVLGGSLVALAQQPTTSPSAATQPAAPRTVRVAAEGLNREDAQRRALRKAIEQVSGVELAAYTKVENFQLIRDTIYSRAAGVVSEFKVLKESPLPGGTFEIQIEAVVRPDAIARTWGEVQHVLDKIGRPKIMVWIVARRASAGCAGRTPPPPASPTPDSSHCPRRLPSCP